MTDEEADTGNGAKIVLKALPDEIHVHCGTFMIAIIYVVDDQMQHQIANILNPQQVCADI